MSLVSMPLEAWPGWGEVHYLFLEAGTNAAEVYARSQDVNQPLPFILLDARMVVSLFLVQIAVNRAIAAEEAGRRRTHTLSSEVMFNLSPNTNIREAMNKFGVKEEPHAILAISIDPKSSADKFTTAVTNLIQGKAVDLSGAIGREVDLIAMCKYFKMDAALAKDADLLEKTMVGIIALKGVSVK